MFKYTIIGITIFILLMFAGPLWYGIVGMSKGSTLAAFILGLVSGSLFTFAISAVNKLFDSVGHLEQGLEERARMQANLEENAAIMNDQFKNLLLAMKVSNAAGQLPAGQAPAPAPTISPDFFNGGFASGNRRGGDEDWEAPHTIELD